MNDTESFEHAMADMRKVVMDDCYMTRCNMYDDDCYQCQQDILERIQRAHERELEHVRKAEFARGYDDGQRSMDAEHYAVALRLRGLRFDGGSHGNLSRIAYAIYPCATGWTCESSEGLRDRLIDLLGGVHEPDAALPTYDALGNERQKAIAELRKLDAEDGRAYICSTEIAHAIGLKYGWTFLRRLIHLLGGDEPTLSEVGTELSQASIDAMSRRADSDESGEESENRGSESAHKMTKSAEIAKPESKDGGEVTITDELREWMDLVLTADDQAWTIADRIDERLKTIRQNDYDEWQLQTDKMRAMLAEQRDEARAKVLRLESENAEWKRGAERDADKLESLTGAYNDAVAERKELQAKLEEANSAIANYKGAIANYREHMKSLDESERLREKLQDKLKELEKFDPDIAMAAYGDDNDELRKLLYRAAKLLANAEQDRDANYAHWMDCKEKVVQKSVTIDELSKELEDARDALNEATGRWARADEERRELQDRLDAIREAVNAV